MKVLSLFIVLLMASSCLKQGEAPKIPGVDGPKLNIADGKILLSVGLEAIDLQGGLTLPIPKLEHSSVAIGPRLEGGTLLQVAFDPRDVKSEYFRVVPAEYLPDGRPFPFTTDGTLPALAINVPKAFDMTFYGSNKLFGFFLPIKLPEEFNVSIHYRLKINGNNVGIVSLIHPSEGREGGGIVLLLTMKQIEENTDFQTLLKHSKKRRFKNTVF